MKTIKTKNINLPVISKVLDYPMTFSQGRVKGRFLNLIGPELAEREKSRLEICEKFAETGEDGKPKIENSKFVFRQGTEEEFSKEIDTLFQEEVIIDVPQQVSNNLHILKELINNSPVYLSNEEVALLDSFMESLENKEK